MKTMRWSVAVIVVVAGAGVHAGERIDRSLDVGASGEVVIDVRRGSVTVEGTSEQKVSVAGTRDDSSTAFVFERDGDVVRIEDRVPDHTRGQGTEIVVRVPSKHEVRANLVSADLDVTDVAGRVRLSTVSGHIEGGRLAGNATLHTVSGDVKVDASGDEFEVETVSGDVDATVAARSLDAKTVSGDIALDDRAQIGRGKISTVSGDVRFTTALGGDGDVTMASVSGDVTVALRGQIDARIRLDAGPGGSISNKLPGATETSVKHGVSERLELGLGSGKADLELTTMSGTLTLKPQ
jgi:DUF4097 and DUF4098 domain-containing protein YvlB